MFPLSNIGQYSHYPIPIEHCGKTVDSYEPEHKASLSCLVCSSEANNIDFNSFRVILPYYSVYI